MKNLKVTTFLTAAVLMAAPVAYSNAQTVNTATQSTVQADTNAANIGLNADANVSGDATNNPNVTGEVTKTTTTTSTNPVTGDVTKTTFVEYDADGDGMLESTEFKSYSYNVIDYNADGKVSPAEWDYYTSTWYKPYDVSYAGEKEFTGYDVDGDGFIEITEYDNAYDPKLYTLWDVDNNGTVDMVEYKTATSNYIVVDTESNYNW